VIGQRADAIEGSRRAALGDGRGDGTGGHGSARAPDGSAHPARVARRHAARPGPRVRVRTGVGHGGATHLPWPPAVSILVAARRRADLERGLAALSPGVGTTERRNTSSASGVRPQAQTGRSGGQMHPRVRSARKRLTRRSSREWNEMAARRPPGQSRSQARGQGFVELCELVVDGDRIPWKVRFGGVAAGEARGCGDRGGDPPRPARRSFRAAPSARAGGRSRPRSGPRSAPRRTGAAPARSGGAPTR
jgi:hypothetical protein